MGIGMLVNESILKSTEALAAAGANETEANGSLKPELNYTTATRLLAERQLKSCSQEITTADLAADQGAGLSDAAVERLLGGTAFEFKLTEVDLLEYDKAIKEEVSLRREAPSILGVQVHNVPWWLQILYMVGVLAALIYVVMLAVNKLMARDKEKAAQKEG